MRPEASTLFFKIATWLNANAHWIGLGYLLLVAPFWIAAWTGRL